MERKSRPFRNERITPDILENPLIYITGAKIYRRTLTGGPFNLWNLRNYPLRHPIITRKGSVTLSPANINTTERTNVPYKRPRGHYLISSSDVRFSKILHCLASHRAALCLRGPHAIVDLIMPICFIWLGVVVAGGRQSWRIVATAGEAV